MDLFSCLRSRGNQEKHSSTNVVSVTGIDEYHTTLHAQHRRDRIQDAALRFRLRFHDSLSSHRIRPQHNERGVCNGAIHIENKSETSTPRPTSKLSGVSYWNPLHHKGKTRDLRAIAAAHSPMQPKEPLNTDLGTAEIFTEAHATEISSLEGLDSQHYSSNLQAGNLIYCDVCKEAFMPRGVGLMHGDRVRVHGVALYCGGYH